jgi:hypothetical protein
MRPHLRNGTPYGTRSKPTPASKFHLCLCESYGCCRESAFVPGSTKIVTGRYLGQQELANHKDADDRMHNRNIYSHQQTAESSSLPPSTPFASHSKPSIGALNEAVGNAAPVRRAPSPKCVAQGLERVCLLQAEFRAWETKDVPSEGLVFKNRPPLGKDLPPVPTRTHINSGPFALEPNSPYNAEFLAFEKSIWEFIVKVENLPRNEATVVYVDGLKALVDEKFHSLEEKKLNEWRRQSRQIDTMYSGLLSQSAGILILMEHFRQRTTPLDHGPP